MIDIKMILLRFGELTLKGRNRARFENRVISHVKEVLSAYPKARINRTYGRLYIQLNGEPYDKVSEQLLKVFGLISFSPVLRAELDLHSIQEAALEMMRNLEAPPRTFKVSARRAYKGFPYPTPELNQLIGGHVLRNIPDLKVDVHRPDTDLHVEIREEGAFIFCEIVPALGGYPLGSNGKAMLMLSGGIDSPVAGWLAMRKGLTIEAVHFHSYPYTSERSQQKVIDLARRLSVYSGRIALHMVPFTDIQLRLHQERADNLLITLMRRAMFRITERLAAMHNASAIVTGESLGQVASQTLSSMNVIGRVVTLPVIRPLVAMDKNEIIRLAEKIDTYATSILPFEDCCTLFVPKNTSTNPNLRITEHIEEVSEWLPDLIDEAVQKTETMWITNRDQQKDAHLF
ncbi:tRNA uracil 4-sulfurtransferase ThiI [Ferviditalea candida]|uniref:Probable tRNA sulfurtransferase n=1 Tax=Ferviditalea candida TaxID=3108399 RepID=A0ABU5ZG46_9BACL|nr:tRNA uracil 4-sulfurtransferase ThiI [Paenibacillaceae bacterium T2]